MAPNAMSDRENSEVRKQLALIWAELQLIFADAKREFELFKLMLRGDIRANSMMNKGIDLAVGVMVVGLLAAFLLPIAIDEVVGVDTSSWGSAETQLFNLLPIFFVLAILLYVVRRAK